MHEGEIKFVKTEWDGMEITQRLGDKYRPLYHNRYYDYIISGAVEEIATGKKFYINCVSEEYERDIPHWRVYAIYDLTKMEWAEEEYRRELWESTVGNYSCYFYDEDGKLIPKWNRETKQHNPPYTNKCATKGSEKARAKYDEAVKGGRDKELHPSKIVGYCFVTTGWYEESLKERAMDGVFDEIADFEEYDTYEKVKTHPEYSKLYEHYFREEYRIREKLQEYWEPVCE